MPQGQILPASTVLLIEADPSLRRLIMLGLCQSGISVVEACSIQELPALDAQKLDLLIVDVDRGVTSDWSLLSILREQTSIASLPIVALSWESPAEDLTCLSKPFDARTLHSMVRALLAERAARKATQLAVIEAQVLASYERHAAPSIWPVITAAGLLLLVMGLLFHFLIALVGVVIVLTSLLLWTLGAKPAAKVVMSSL